MNSALSLSEGPPVLPVRPSPRILLKQELKGKEGDTSTLIHVLKDLWDLLSEGLFQASMQDP